MEQTRDLWQRIRQIEDPVTRTLKELASFVHSRLSTIEGVTGTSTHFMLKTYKYAGMVFDGGRSDRRQAVMP